MASLEGGNPQQQQQQHDDVTTDQYTVDWLDIDLYDFYPQFFGAQAPQQENDDYIDYNDYNSDYANDDHLIQVLLNGNATDVTPGRRPHPHGVDLTQFGAQNNVFGDQVVTAIVISGMTLLFMVLCVAIFIFCYLKSRRRQLLRERIAQLVEGERLLTSDEASSSSNTSLNAEHRLKSSSKDVLFSKKKTGRKMRQKAKEKLFVETLKKNARKMSSGKNKGLPI